MSFKEIYENYRAVGMPREQARMKAFQDSLREAEDEQLAMGITYDEDKARQAIVHTREDIAFLVHSLMQVNKQLGGIKRWLIAIAVLLVLILLKEA